MRHNAPSASSALQWLAVSFMAISVFADRAGASNLPNNDLDSLVYLADHIVEGEIVRGYDVEYRHVLEVKLSAIHAGSMHVGQVIRVDGSPFCKAAEFPLDCQNLAAGDKLFLFLLHNPYARPPKEEKETFRPAGSGIKLVVGNKVYDSRQFSNPGGYVASEDRGQTPASTRESIKQSIPRAAAWHREFDRPPEKKDLPGLVALLEARSHVRKSSYYGDDVIADIAVARLASLHDIPSLVKAAPIDAGDPNMLGRGFGTPEGREFLLMQICDPKLPMAQRQRFATLLGDAGAIYDITLTGLESHTRSWEGKLKPRNSSYMTRIARIAAARSLGEDLTDDLLKALQTMAFPPSDEAEIRADMNEACEILVPVYKSKNSSGTTKRLIRDFMQMMGRETYERLWGEVQ